jgi:hypothetical protein
VTVPRGASAEKIDELIQAKVHEDHQAIAEVPLGRSKIWG